MKPLPKQHHPVHSLPSTFKLDVEVIKQGQAGERRQGSGREKGGIMANCGEGTVCTNDLGLYKNCNGVIAGYLSLTPKLVFFPF
jgi:hypothetical protein